MRKRVTETIFLSGSKDQKNTNYVPYPSVILSSFIISIRYRSCKTYPIEAT